MRFINKINLMTVILAAWAQFAGAADLCTGAVDPYDIVTEKGLFYASAGKDNELTASEFSGKPAGDGSFRRKFDKWSEMLKFDRDGNKSLDWMEAGAYRYTMRKMVLDAYDANRDGKLTDAERTAACKAVSAGKIRFSAKPTAALPPPPRHGEKSKHSKPSKHKSEKRHEPKTRRTEHKKPEPPKTKTKHNEREIAERNKRIAEAKKTAANKKIKDTQRAAAKEAARQATLKRIAAAREAAQRRSEEKRLQKEVERFDKNKDGTLDEKESAALGQYRDDQKRRLREFTEKYDTNGDGKISSEEKKAYLQELKDQRKANEKKKPKKDSGKQKPPKSKKKYRK
ncbi:MAG: hypothetical protein HN350_17785 [Phycisphaerales bacterium]|jgi:Ca2+-binding EF-hand superfamily protein|nr:hypothetical protein [Phycisphaerales bacterium]